MIFLLRQFLILAEKLIILIFVPMVHLLLKKKKISFFELVYSLYSVSLTLLWTNKPKIDKKENGLSHRYRRKVIYSL